jgi:ATP-binding cassette subfamily F protein uup
VKERPRKLSFKEERELEALPARIGELEAEQAELHATLADPDFYKTDGSRVGALNERLAALDAALAAAYERWELLESQRSG